MKVEVKNVTKRFKDNTVLNNVNITFESGKIYGLLGRNGSGKSVLLKLLCGFYNPDQGEILYDGVNIVGDNIFPPNTRALIEKPNFLPDLTGMENLKLLASIQNRIKVNDILKIVEQLNLKNDINKKYKTYSLGTKQKLGIAQVLMENPDVIILDEPLNGVENEKANKIRKLLLSKKNEGKLIIIASHIKDDFDAIIDEVYEFDNGNVNKK